METIQEQQAPTQDPVAESASVETQFGAPVVRELPPDPGPHEFLITVRAVAARLGLAVVSHEVVHAARSSFFNGVSAPHPACGRLRL